MPKCLNAKPVNQNKRKLELPEIDDEIKRSRTTKKSKKNQENQEN
jgi:hypothetical protein